MTRTGPYVLGYTRQPQEGQIYSPKLAYSLHLAYSEDGRRYEALNHNSGVLFALATERTEGTLAAKSLRQPYLFLMADGTYGIVAIRTEADGTPDEESEGAVLLFTSTDLIRYEEHGLLHLGGNGHVQDLSCEYNEQGQRYVIHWRGEDGCCYRNELADITQQDQASRPERVEDSNRFPLPAITVEIEGAVPRNAIPIASDIAKRLRSKLTVPTHIANRLPERVEVVSPDQVEAIKVTSLYSDGTTADKPVDWEMDGIDWSRPGSYRIEGRIRQHRYPFPIATHRADPCIAKWEGRYYFIATNDADGNHSLSIRAARTLPELVTAAETKILDTEQHDHLKNFLWAPEFHQIDGKLYLFHAGSTGEFGDIQSHVMKLKQGGDPAMAADWETPVRVVRHDGRPLFESGITLDMTVLDWRGRLYVLWAQRQFVPHDLGSWIYIAEADRGQPWKLLSEPVLLSKPDYGWANNHTFVDEGPYALITEDHIFVTIASALVDATYCVGLLRASHDADLLDARSWTKGNYPLLTSRSVPGQFGPGHNSYVTDDDGVIWNAFHARPGIDQPRSAGLRRVHFDIDGDPVLNLTEEKDVNPELAQVRLKVVVSEVR